MFEFKFKVKKKKSKNSSFRTIGDRLKKKIKKGVNKFARELTKVSE